MAQAIPPAHSPIVLDLVGKSENSPCKIATKARKKGRTFLWGKQGTIVRVDRTRDAIDDFLLAMFLPRRWTHIIRIFS